MVGEQASNIIRNTLNTWQIFVTQTDTGLNSSVIHSAWIFDRVGSEEGIWDIKWPTIKGANSGVIPANSLHCSLHACGANPVTF